jgi:hypothetical protein
MGRFFPTNEVRHQRELCGRAFKERYQYNESLAKAS